jgi:hypothetical protein
MGNLPLDCGSEGQDGLGEAPLVERALSLDRVTDAYERTVDLFYETELHAPQGPWLGRMHARAERLLTECRMRARLLADTPARTLVGAAAKSQALLRYCEVDLECDPRGFQVIHSLCADMERLAAKQTTPPEAAQRLLVAKTSGRCRDSRRWQEG